jgi:hypothetical protein
VFHKEQPSGNEGAYISACGIDDTGPIDETQFTYIDIGTALMLGLDYAVLVHRRTGIFIFSPHPAGIRIIFPAEGAKENRIFRIHRFYTASGSVQDRDNASHSGFIGFKHFTGFI